MTWWNNTVFILLTTNHWTLVKLCGVNDVLCQTHQQHWNIRKPRSRNQLFPCFSSNSFVSGSKVTLRFGFCCNHDDWLLLNSVTAFLNLSCHWGPFLSVLSQWGVLILNHCSGFLSTISACWPCNLSLVVWAPHCSAPITAHVLSYLSQNACKQ